MHAALRKIARYSSASITVMIAGVYTALAVGSVRSAYAEEPINWTAAAYHPVTCNGFALSGMPFTNCFKSDAYWRVNPSSGYVYQGYGGEVLAADGTAFSAFANASLGSNSFASVVGPRRVGGDFHFACSWGKVFTKDTPKGCKYEGVVERITQDYNITEGEKYVKIRAYKVIINEVKHSYYTVEIYTDMTQYSMSGAPGYKSFSSVTAIVPDSVILSKETLTSLARSVQFNPTKF